MGGNSIQTYDLGYLIYFWNFDHYAERELLNAWIVDKISLFDVRFSLGTWSTHWTQKEFLPIVRWRSELELLSKVLGTFFGGTLSPNFMKYIESQPKMRYLELKSQAKSDYARKSDVSSILHVPSTLKLFSALWLPKLMRHQIITFRV